VVAIIAMAVLGRGGIVPPTLHGWVVLGTHDLPAGAPADTKLTSWIYQIKWI